MGIFRLAFLVRFLSKPAALAAPAQMTRHCWSHHFRPMTLELAGTVAAPVATLPFGETPHITSFPVDQDGERERATVHPRDPLIHFHDCWREGIYHYRDLHQELRIPEPSFCWFESGHPHDSARIEVCHIS